MTEMRVVLKGEMVSGRTKYRQVNINSNTYFLKRFGILAKKVKNVVIKDNTKTIK